MFTILLALGLASQIHYRPVTLPELIAASPTIVVVEDADPSSRSITIPAGPVSIETRLMRVKVSAVVRAPEGQVVPGQVLEIGAANLDMQRTMARDYHAHGISKSPIYAQYSGSSATGQRVMFLAPCGVPGGEPGLCLAAEGAVESPEALERVRELAVP